MTTEELIAKAEKLLWGLGLCTYCGEPATEKEHALTKKTIKQIAGNTDIALARKYAEHFKVVPTCTECNILLANSYQTKTLSARVLLVKSKLRKKYAKLLTLPEWTTEELAELSASLVADIIRMLDRKQNVKTRLEYFVIPGNNKQGLCLVCGEEFKAKRKWQKYCSSDCRLAAFSLQHPKIQI